MTFESQLLSIFDDTKSQIAEDIKALNFSPDIVADYGCGIGITTLALSVLLHPISIIGIDNDLAAIKIAKVQTPELIHRLTESNISQPVFAVGDVVTGKGLPCEISFGYSRRLLGNVWRPFYEDPVTEQTVLNKALFNISSSLSRKGWLIIVEETAQHNNYTRYLEEAGLVVQERVDFTYSGTVLPMKRYICRKQIDSN